MPLDRADFLPDEEPNFSPGKYLSLFPTTKYTDNLKSRIEEMRVTYGYTDESIDSFRCLLHMQIQALILSVPNRNINSRSSGVSDIDYDSVKHLITFTHFSKRVSIKIYLGNDISDKVKQVKKMVATIRNKNPNNFVVSAGKKERLEGDPTIIITSPTGVISL